MATSPWTTPYTPPSQCQDTGNGTAYDNADFDEALCLGHGNATHKPNSDNPVFDPDTFWSHAPRWMQFPVRRRLGAFPQEQHQPGRTYQYLMTIAGGEIICGRLLLRRGDATGRRCTGITPAAANKPADAGHSPCSSPLFRRRT